MTIIPKGDYLTVEQYRAKMGIANANNVYRAIREGRIEGIVRIDKRTILIPANAVLINKSIKHGRYIGRNAWVRGEIEHQDELKNWELRQRQLKKLRNEDNDDL